MQSIFLSWWHCVCLVLIGMISNVGYSKATYTKEDPGRDGYYDEETPGIKIFTIHLIK